MSQSEIKLFSSEVVHNLGCEDAGEDEGEEDDEDEPKLEIVDEAMDTSSGNEENTKTKGVPPASISQLDEVKKSADAIESLLMLGRGPVISHNIKTRQEKMSPIMRRYSSSSSEMALDCSSSGPLASSSMDKGNGTTYYQRMRERNNEASKRCRLKRRLKAESMETQGNMLQVSNRLLKQRLTRLEKVSEIMKEGVRLIQFKTCKCVDTVEQVKRANVMSEEDNKPSNLELIQASEKCRKQNIILDSKWPGGSSDDDTRMDLTTPAMLPSSTSIDSPQPFPRLKDLTLMRPREPTLTFPGRSELSVTPVIRLENAAPPKTALDVINDTIVRSLSNPSTPTLVPCPVSTSTPTTTSLPLNLVNLIPAAPASQAKQIILLSSSARRPSLGGSSTTLTFSSTPTSLALPRLSFAKSFSSVNADGVKCQPEIQILECEPPNGKHIALTRSLSSPCSSIPSSPASSCLARDLTSKFGPCQGDLVNISKLTSHIDLVTRTSTRVSEATVMERAIIKSRIGVPFWKADEPLSMFVCCGHRSEILNTSSALSSCFMCGKKRNNNAATNNVMMTITYRVSLQNYTTSGKILPIGYLVCLFCKDKHLRGVDFANSQIVPLTPDQDVKKEVVTNGINFNKGSTPIKTIPVLTSTASSSSSSSSTIFSKMVRLNSALQSLNPLYKPIGFSITSIDSCSNSVLQDAVAATETAVLTLMSVIAPGQESYLWESIKPKLDSKLGRAVGGQNHPEADPVNPVKVEFKWNDKNEVNGTDNNTEGGGS